MKIVILILLHEFSKQQERLINHLCKDFDIFIHIDKKSNIQPQDISSLSDNIFVYKKYKVYWGHYNQICATLFLYQKAHEKQYDRYIFISGSDIPIKSNQYIQDFFDYTNKEYLGFEKLPRKDWNGNGGFNRINYFHSKFVGAKQSAIQRLYSRINNKFASLCNKAFKYLQINRTPIGGGVFGGPNWMDLTNNCVSQVLEFTKKNKRFLCRFKYTRCADEIFFQTIICNHVNNIELEKKSLRYVDWTSGPEYPKILRKEDFERIQASSALFARKFDYTVDSEAIDLCYQLASKNIT